MLTMPAIGWAALQDYDRQLFNSFAAGRTPDLIITSPGAHDCFHYPAEYSHHSLELRRYYQHLHLVRTISHSADLKASQLSIPAGVMYF